MLRKIILLITISIGFIGCIHVRKSPLLDIKKEDMKTMSLQNIADLEFEKIKNMDNVYKAGYYMSAKGYSIDISLRNYCTSKGGEYKRIRFGHLSEHYTLS